MKAPEPTSEEIKETLARIEARGGVNNEAEADRDRRRQVEIYDDCIHVDTGRRTFLIPQPTLGFSILYRERREYFEDDEHGLGRLLVGLRRMKEPGYVRALRIGTDIPDEEAAEAIKNVHLEDKVDYYLALERFMEWAEDETEKKTAKLLELRTGLGSDLMARLLNLSNLQDTPLMKSSTESTSAPSET